MQEEGKEVRCGSYRFSSLLKTIRQSRLSFVYSVRSPARFLADVIPSRHKENPAGPCVPSPSAGVSCRCRCGEGTCAGEVALEGDQTKALMFEISPQSPLARAKLWEE